MTGKAKFLHYVSASHQQIALIWILQGFLNNTLIVKYDGCVAEKSSTKRITIALSCASMTGEKVAPLVIDKSRQPRCFSKIKPETLQLNLSCSTMTKSFG